MKKIKLLYLKHTPLCEAFTWVLIMLMVIFFWPHRTLPVIGATEETEKTGIQIRTESLVPLVCVAPYTITVSKSKKEPEPIIKPPLRYGFTNDEIYLMAVLLTGSKDVNGDGEFDFDYGRSDEYDQISLVLCVVMNRVRSNKYPNTVSEVIWQENQFHPMRKWKKSLPQVSDISLQIVTDWCEAYDANDPGAQTIPEEHLYFSGNGRVNCSR